jgi:hypothetical protein
VLSEPRIGQHSCGHQCDGEYYTDIWRSTFRKFTRATTCPLQLKNEDGSDRGGNRQKPLCYPCHEIYLVRHVNSPLIESIEL